MIAQYPHYPLTFWASELFCREWGTTLLGNSLPYCPVYALIEKPDCSVVMYRDRITSHIKRYLASYWNFCQFDISWKFSKLYKKSVLFVGKNCFKIADCYFLRKKSSIGPFKLYMAFFILKNCLVSNSDGKSKMVNIDASDVDVPSRFSKHNLFRQLKLYCRSNFLL